MDDQEASLAEDVQRIRSSPYLPAGPAGARLRLRRRDRPGRGRRPSRGVRRSRLVRDAGRRRRRWTAEPPCRTLAAVPGTPASECQPPSEERPCRPTSTPAPRATSASRPCSPSPTRRSPSARPAAARCARSSAPSASSSRARASTRPTAAAPRRLRQRRKAETSDATARSGAKADAARRRQGRRRRRPSRQGLAEQGSSSAARPRRPPQLGRRRARAPDRSVDGARCRPSGRPPAARVGLLTPGGGRVADVAEIGVHRRVGAVRPARGRPRRSRSRRRTAPPSDPVVVGEVGGPDGRVPAAARPRPPLPAAPHPLPRQPVGAAQPGRAPGAGAVRRRRPAPRARTRLAGRAATSSSTAPPAGCRPSTTAARCTSPFADPYCPRGRAVAVRPARAAGLAGHRRRHAGRRRGPALLHPGRVAVVRRAGLVRRQHDRAPRGGPRPRARALLHRASRWSPTSTPGSRAAEPSRRPRCCACSRDNTARLRALLLDVVAALPTSSATARARHALDGLHPDPALP